MKGLTWSSQTSLKADSQDSRESGLILTFYPISTTLRQKSILGIVAPNTIYKAFSQLFYRFLTGSLRSLAIFGNEYSFREILNKVAIPYKVEYWKE